MRLSRFFSHHISLSSDHGDGFTLLETLVSFTIITLSLVSIITLAASSVQSFHNAKHQYLATKTSQEGMELAINKRDNNVLCMKSNSCSLSSWQDNLIGTWTVDATDTDRLLANRTFRTYNASDLICVKTNPPRDRGKFGICQGSEQPLQGDYNRSVSITSLSAQAILVRSTVTWRTRLFPRSVVAEQVLFGLP